MLFIRLLYRYAEEIIRRRAEEAEATKISHQTNKVMDVEHHSCRGYKP